MKRKKLVPLPRLKQRLWDIFSIYIRRRDADEYGNVKCISCPTVAHWKQGDAGHFKKRGKLGTFVDERNNHFQCKRCNHYMGGNESSYAVALVRRYGPEILEELERLSESRDKYTRDEYEVLIETYKKKVRDLDGFVFGAR